MTDGRDLLNRYLELGAQLPESEFDALLELLRRQPALAIELKDQLLVGELLAQRFDLTRYHFGLQMAQRIEDETSGTPRLHASELAELATVPSRRTSAAELRSSASSQERPPVSAVPAPAQRATTAVTPQVRPRSRSARWRVAIAGTMMLLAVIAVWGRWPRGAGGLARFETCTGTVSVVRRDSVIPATAAGRIEPRDRIVVGEDSRAVIRFLDGTVLRLDAQTDLMLELTPAHGRRIEIAHGELSADVAPQPAGAPLVFQSATALAEVIGTTLRVQVTGEQTQVTVTEGTVRVERLSDHASRIVSPQQFAVISPEILSVVPVDWPSNRNGLMFLFETNDRPNLVRSSSTGMNRSFSLRPRGRAHLNHDYAMVLTGGAFLTEDVDGEILSGCRQTNELTVEATIRPERKTHSGEGPARIVTFSTTVLERDFTIGQDRDRLVVRIRTPQTGPNGVNGIENGVPLCTLVAGQVHHLVVSYRPGRLVCYLNGKKVFDGAPVQGDFSGWSAQHLLFGDEYGGGRNWAGELEGVALYNRFMEPEEAQRNALQYQHLRLSRRPVSRVKVQAELIAKSTVPTMGQIQPHRSALLTCKYDVKQVLEGQLEQTSISVAQWVLLDGQSQPIVDESMGQIFELTLEPLDRNPQAQAYLYSDDFAFDDSLPRFLEMP